MGEEFAGRREIGGSVVGGSEVGSESYNEVEAGGKRKDSSKSYVKRELSKGMADGDAEGENGGVIGEYGGCIGEDGLGLTKVENASILPHRIMT